MTWLYKPRPGHSAIDMRRCRALVQGFLGGGQCSRKGTIDRDGIKYCRQHDPEVKKVKNEARQAKYEADRAAYKAQIEKERAQQKLAHDAIDAIRQIAAGHSDPQTLAQSVLKGTET